MAGRVHPHRPAVISLARYLILVRRQGMTRMVDCRPANEADVLRADVTPLVEALGAVVDIEGLDLGILVVHGMHDSPCLHCPSREQPKHLEDE